MNKQQEREEAIISVCENYAFITKEGDYLIDTWGLAWNLNNNWAAKLFTSEKNKKDSTCCGDDWAVASYNLGKLFRMITWTINRMKGASVIKQGLKTYPKIFYKIKKESMKDKQLREKAKELFKDIIVEKVNKE